MIVRRFASLGRAIATQHWRTAIVDLAIVIVGLLLGLQLNAYVDAARKARDERGYLERLRDETGTNLAMARRVEQLQRRTLNELFRINRATGSHSDIAAMRSVRGFGCSMLHLPAVRVVDTAYRELADGNKLDLLQDAPLRAELGRALSQHEFVVQQIAYFRQSYQLYRQTLGPYHRYTVEADGSVSCSIDVAALLRDRWARQTASALYRDQKMVLIYRHAETGTTAAILARLDLLLGRPGK